tara:strand:- start:166 stop:726 length:561 start_codon:yes stop_codon:yes gene_type:complete
VKVFDNIISKKDQVDLKNLLLKDDYFPWYYCSDISKKDNKYQSRPGFKHNFMIDGKVNSEHYIQISKIFEKVNKKIKKELIPHKVRSFLQLPLDKKFTGKGVDTPHLDLEIPHTVFLYYVNDSDGNTIIYNYKSKDVNDVPYFEDMKIEKNIIPKQGRVVVFDGFYWHTAGQPTKGPRCIINFDMV